MSTYTDVGFKVAGAAFENALKMLADLPKGDSLVGYAQAGVVEPSCLVDEAVRTSDILPEVLQLAQSVYGGYYLRAFSMHNISIGNVSLSQRLDKFATRRSPGNAVVSSIARIGMEDFDDRLVIDGDIRELPEDIKALEDELRKDLESVEKAATGAGLESLNAPMKGQKPGKSGPQFPGDKTFDGELTKGANNAGASSSVTIGKSVDIGEPVNIGSGRMINVTVKEDGREVQVPVLIRLNAMYMATQPLIHILASSSQDISLGARFKKWRLGGIDFWRDVVFCQDLIDSHKKNLQADKTGMYLQIMNKRRQNSISAAVSGSLSANQASNIIILSSESAKELELKIFGKLTDFNTRQRIFQQGYGMLMFIVDKQWGTVRMYTRDIPEHTELSDRDLRAANKKGGIDIGDVLTAFRAGSSPRM